VNALLLSLLVLAAPPPTPAEAPTKALTEAPPAVRGQDPGSTVTTGYATYPMSDGVLVAGSLPANTFVEPQFIEPQFVEPHYGTPADVYLHGDPYSAPLDAAVPCEPLVCPAVPVPECRPRPVCKDCHLHHEVFYDYLFLSATDADLVYAVPVDGFFGPQVLTGPPPAWTANLSRAIASAGRTPWTAIAG
jgi:hypothetical protein